jgi:hypothetical protein
MILPRLPNCLPRQSNSGTPSSAWLPPIKQARAFAAGLGEDIRSKGLEPVESRVEDRRDVLRR